MLDNKERLCEALQCLLENPKEERACKKAVAILIKGKQLVPDHLLQPIVDPKVESQTKGRGGGNLGKQ